MGRTLPSMCEHGVTVDWGDFGGGCGQRCAQCDAARDVAARRRTAEADVIRAAEEVARWVDDIDLSLHPCCNDRDYAPNAMQAQQDALAALSAAVAALRAAREDTDR